MDTFEWLAKLMVIIAMGAGTLALVRLAVFGKWASRHRLVENPGAAELTQLRDVVERLNGEVAELQERVDFAERMLAQQRERPGLAER